MKNLNTSVAELIRVLPIDKRKQASVLIEKETDKYSLNYGIMKIALGDTYQELPEDVVEAYWGTTSDNLIEVDTVIASIIVSLSEATGRNVRGELMELFTLDPTFPEMSYLADSIIAYLKTI